MIRVLQRYRLKKLEEALESITSKGDDKADTIQHPNERNFHLVEHEWIAARNRERQLKDEVKALKAKLAEPPIFWWATEQGRYDRNYPRGYALAVEKLKTNSPEMVLTETVGLTPFEGKAFHDGVRAAVADFLVKEGPYA